MGHCGNLVPPSLTPAPALLLGHTVAAAAGQVNPRVEIAKLI